jgi:hypothetical protein
MAVVGLTTGLLVSCGLPSALTPPSSSLAPSPGSATGRTALLLTSVWGAVGPIEPPLTTSCQDGGKRVIVRGPFGPETAEVQLGGLHPNRHYSFVAFQPAVSATVRVAETGPIPLSSIYGGPSTDYLGPDQGLEPQGSAGTLSVAKSGRSGSLRVTLPRGDSISGHWACGSSNTSGAPSPPVLPPAGVPPVVHECWTGVPFSTVPPPATCANGNLNVAAWLPRSAVESAGAHASLTTVELALCQDQSQNSQGAAYLETEYAVSTVYYGWNFHLSPVQVLADANCSNTS